MTGGGRRASIVHDPAGRPSLARRLGATGLVIDLRGPRLCPTTQCENAKVLVLRQELVTNFEIGNQLGVSDVG